MNARANTKIFFNTQTFTRLFLFKITLLKMYVCSMEIAYTIKKQHTQIILLFICNLNKQTSKDKNQAHPHHIKRTPSY